MSTERIASISVVFSLFAMTYPVALYGECPPWKLVPSRAVKDSACGSRVAINGTWAVVGSELPETAATVFAWTGSGWVENATLESSDGYAAGAVDVSGDSIAAYWSDQSVRIFRFVVGDWVQEGHLLGPSTPSSAFGVSLRLSNDVCIVGDNDQQSSGPGRAFVFRRVGGQWALEDELTASDGQTGDDFGWTVSIDGEFALVGAWLKHDACWPTCNYYGAAYVYRWDGQDWGQIAKLHPSYESGEYGFGSAVSIAGTSASIIATGTRSLFNFQWNGSGWNQVGNVYHSTENSFGWGFPGLSTTTDVGAIGIQGANDNRGQVSVWDALGGRTLEAPDGASEDRFGVSVGVGGGFLIAGAPGHFATEEDSGAAYVFPVASIEMVDCNRNLQPDIVDVCNGSSSDCNSNAVPEECEMYVTSTSPPNGAIDARQPTSLDGLTTFGWDYVDISFNASVIELVPIDFNVEEFGVVGLPIDVLFVVPLGGDEYRLILSSPIRPNRWTTIHHNCLGQLVRLGFLPGDVNGDRQSRPLDILSLIDALNGVGQPLPLWSVDINGSGLAEPSDILREIDLLNGAEALEVYNGASLP